MTTLDQVIAHKLNEWTILASDGTAWPIGNFVLCTIAIILCLILCGFVGYEREKRGRTAGLRTHLLVGAASCVLMIISIYGFPSMADSNMSRDMARLAAAVITGVGFLGTGAIIHRSTGSKGLTTAATIWVCMAIGLACGSMNFLLAIGLTTIIMITLVLLKKFEGTINKRNPLVIVHAESHKALIAAILEAAKKHQCTISDIRSELMDETTLEITFNVVFADKKYVAAGFIDALETIDGVKNVEFLNNHKFN